MARGGELLQDTDGGVHGRDHGPLPGLAVGDGGPVVVAGGLELDPVQPVADRPGAIVGGRGAASGLEVEELGGTQTAEVSDYDQAGCAQAQREGRGLMVGDRAGPRLRRGRGGAQLVQGAVQPGEAGQVPAGGDRVGACQAVQERGGARLAWRAERAVREVQARARGGVQRAVRQRLLLSGGPDRGLAWPRCPAASAFSWSRGRGGRRR